MLDILLYCYYKYTKTQEQEMPSTDISISNFISSVNNALNDNTRSFPPHHPPSFMQTKSFHMRVLLSLSLFPIKCVSISSESHHHNQHKHSSSTNNKHQPPHTHTHTSTSKSRIHIYLTISSTNKQHSHLLLFS